MSTKKRASGANIANSVIPVRSPIVENKQADNEEDKQQRIYRTTSGANVFVQSAMASYVNMKAVENAFDAHKVRQGQEIGSHDVGSAYKSEGRASGANDASKTSDSNAAYETTRERYRQYSGARANEYGARTVASSQNENLPEVIRTQRGSDTNLPPVRVVGFGTGSVFLVSSSPEALHIPKEAMSQSGEVKAGGRDFFSVESVIKDKEQIKNINSVYAMAVENHINNAPNVNRLPEVVGEGLRDKESLSQRGLITTEDKLATRTSQASKVYAMAIIAHGDECYVPNGTATLLYQSKPSNAYLANANDTGLSLPGNNNAATESRNKDVAANSFHKIKYYTKRDVAERVVHSGTLHCMGEYVCGSRYIKETDAGRGYNEVAQYATLAMVAALVVGMDVAITAEATKVAMQQMFGSRKVAGGESFTGVRDVREKAIETMKSVLKNADSPRADRALRSLKRVDFNKASSLRKYTRTINRAAVELGLPSNITHMTDTALMDLINSSTTTEAQKALLRGAYQVKGLDKMAERTTIDIMHGNGVKTKLKKINYNSKHSVGTALGDYSKYFRENQKVDLTRKSERRLKTVLSKHGNTMSQGEKDMILDIIKLKKIQRLQKMKEQFKSVGRASIVMFLSKQLSDLDAFAGGRMVMQAIQCAKTALILANTVRRVTGMALLGIGKGLYVVTGARHLMHHTAAGRKIINAKDSVVEAKASLSHTVKTLTNAAKDGVRDRVRNSFAGRRIRAIRTSINNMRARVLGSRVFNNPVTLAMKRVGDILNNFLFSPAKKALEAMAKFFAKMKTAVVVVVAVIAILFILMSFAYSICTAIGSYASTSSSAVQNKDDKTETADIKNSLFAKVYNELTQCENNWNKELDDIADPEKSTPASVFGAENQSKYTGYYDPLRKTAHIIKRFGQPTSAEGDGAYTTGVTYYFADGDNHDSLNQSTVKYCMSLGHGFIEADYENYSDVFEEYCLGLWEHSHLYRVLPTQCRACSVGDENVQYRCSKGATANDYLYNAKNLCVIYGDYDAANNKGIGNKGKLASRTSQGCRKIVHDVDGTAYTDTIVATNKGTHYTDVNAGPVASQKNATLKEVSIKNKYTVNTVGMSTQTISQTCTYKRSSACSCKDITYCSNWYSKDRGLLSPLTAAQAAKCTNKTKVFCNGCKQKAYTCNNVLTIDGVSFNHAKMTVSQAEMGNFYKCTVTHIFDKNGKYIADEWNIPGKSVYRTAAKSSTSTVSCGAINANNSPITQHFGVYFNCLGHIFYIEKVGMYCPGHVCCGGHSSCSGHYYCPGHTARICTGHIDAKVSAVILDMGENPDISLDVENGLSCTSKNSLFNAQNFVEDGWPEYTDLWGRAPDHSVKDAQGKVTTPKVGEWTKDMIFYVNSIYNTDWYDTYGLSSISTQGSPFEQSEITSIMKECFDGKDLSGERKKLCNYALQSCGKIPYYYGGNPNTVNGHYLPGYDGNNFGSTISGDYKGRTSKGLDCTGWIYWVYISYDYKDGDAFREPFTLGQFRSGDVGETIRVSQCKPGDILTWHGDSPGMGHVGIFLRWADDAHTSIITIEETPNVTTTKTRSANFWDYGSRVFPN